MSPYRIIFRIAAALALILFFLMTYEPAHCQTPTSTSSVQAAQHTLQQGLGNQMALSPK